MYTFKPTLKNINDNLFSKALGFDEMQNVYRMRMVFFNRYTLSGIDRIGGRYGKVKKDFISCQNIKYILNPFFYDINEIIKNKKYFVISYSGYLHYSFKNIYGVSRLNEYMDISKDKFIPPVFSTETIYDIVIISSTFADRIEFISKNFGLLNLYIFHITFVYIENIFKILKIGGDIVMRFLPVHISACAELSMFLFSHFEKTSCKILDGNMYIYLKKFKGYDHLKWSEIMAYWKLIDPEYGVNYKHDKGNDIILKNALLRIDCMEGKQNIFFDKVFAEDIDFAYILEINNIISNYQKKIHKYLWKIEHNIDYLISKYYKTFIKFAKFCDKKEIQINPAFQKYKIQDIFDIKTLKQYIFKNKKYYLIYDVLYNLFDNDKDFIDILERIIPTIKLYSICFYNLKNSDFKYIISTFKSLNDIDINIYNASKRMFKKYLSKYCTFDELSNKYGIVICRYKDYKKVHKYADNIIFIENIDKYNPNIGYTTYNNISYTHTGYFSTTKSKYQIYNCYNDKKSKNRLLLLLKRIIKFDKISELEMLIKKKQNDYEIYKFLYDQTKNKTFNISKGFTHAAEINNMIQYANKKVNTFLDFGAGTGIKTEAVKNILKLSNDNVYALDLDNFESVDNKKYEYKFNYIYYDGVNYPNINIQFDLITCIQVLHHALDINNTIKYIKNLLKKDGLLIIKEHCIEIDNDKISLLIDIEHSLYELVRDKNIEFLNKYYARYFSEIEFIRIMILNGFIYVPPQKDYVSDEQNPTNYIYYMFTH